MPRNRSTEIELRDAQVRADAAKGMSKTALAAKYGRSVTRICQILAEETDVPDEDQRSWLLAGYQGGIEILQAIAEGPGRAITSGKGEHVIDANTGLPAYDPSPVIDAVRTQGQLRKNVAQLLGSEKPVVKPLEETPDFSDAMEWLKQTSKENEALKAQNAALAARLAAIEGAHPADVVELLILVLQLLDLVQDSIWLEFPLIVMRGLPQPFLQLIPGFIDLHLASSQKRTCR